MWISRPVTELSAVLRIVGTGLFSPMLLIADLMADYWRLIRNQYTRSVYDALKALGITATRMYEYQAKLPQTNATRSPATLAGTSIDLISASEVDSRDIDFDFSQPVDMLDGEWAVIASIDGQPVGRTLVTYTSRPYIDPLERALPISGAYVRRVFVMPERRGKGVASVILRAATELARDEFNADTATALIAADNKASRGLFEGCGFERVGFHEYVRLGAFSRYRYRSC